VAIRPPVWWAELCGAGRMTLSFTRFGADAERVAPATLSPTGDNSTGPLWPHEARRERTSVEVSSRPGRIHDPRGREVDLHPAVSEGFRQRVHACFLRIGPAPGNKLGGAERAVT